MACGSRARFCPGRGSGAVLFCTLDSGTVGTAGPRPPLATVIEAFAASRLRCGFGGPRLEKLDGGFVTPPGVDSDLIVRADLRLFHRL